MPHHDDQHFLEACKALSALPAFRRELKKRFVVEDASQIVQLMNAKETLPWEFSEATDLVVDFLCNEAPVVKNFEAEQDKGVYHVTIRGFPGAYFVQAAEYDDSEVFPTRDDAMSYIERHFGEFLC